MELDPGRDCAGRGCLVGHTNSVCTITLVAKMPGENHELLEEISSNDDNLDYGDIVTIRTGDDETNASFTDDGIAI